MSLDTSWDSIVARSVAQLGDDATAAHSRSVAHARALGAGAAMYRDQRERGSAADRESLLLAGAAAAEQLLESDPAGSLTASVDPAVIGELGDRSLDGMVVLAHGSLGELVVESMLADGSLPMPDVAVASELAGFTQPGWGLAFALDDGTTLTANVTIAESNSAVLRHFVEHPDVPLVYASSDAARGLPDSIEVVDASAPNVTVDRPTVVDIGIESAELTDVLLAGLEPSSFELGGELVDAVPVFALGLIAARATHRLLTTDDDAKDVRDAALSSSSDVMVNSGVGQLAAIVTGAQLIAAPVTITTALARTLARRTSRSVGNSHETVTRARAEIDRISSWYQGSRALGPPVTDQP